MFQRKKPKHDIEWKKRTIKLWNNYIFTFDSIQHQQIKDVLSLVAFTNGRFDKLSLNVSDV